jgi:hypothetical protein
LIPWVKTRLLKIASGLGVTELWKREAISGGTRGVVLIANVPMRGGVEVGTGEGLAVNVGVTMASAVCVFCRATSVPWISIGDALGVGEVPGRFVVAHPAKESTSTTDRIDSRKASLFIVVLLHRWDC